MRIAYLSAALVALFTAPAVSPAFAQDMAMPFNGLYAGINGGYDFSKNNVRTSGIAPANAATVADGARPALVKMDNEGFLGGVQLGRNWQMNQYVFGLETDAQYSDMRDTRNIVTTGTAFPGTRNNQFRQNMNWFGTTRARLGYAWDNSMVYGTGGVAYGRLKETTNFSGPAPASTQQFTSSYNTHTNFGYTVGAGFEQALGDNFSVKTEYLYYDLGRSPVYSNVIAGSGGTGNGYLSSFNNKGQVVRVGINYRMN
ncbi:MAG: porin family protein [Alphaproteobacteria bacterium]|nr:porin family protein [Alphaproteobacteria bacterium]